MSENVTVSRPIGVTILAILAGVAAVLAGFHMLQSLGILPYTIGPYSVRGFNLWNTLMWGIMLWIWIWVIQMLWSVDEGAWIFLAVISIFNLILDFTYLMGKAEWSDVSLSFIVNGVILLYLMLPGTRKAFGRK
jgi:hypothetical protein